MNFTDLSFLLIPEVAMEADDITKQVNQIMGGKNAPAETKTDDQRDEDLTQTDNLFNDVNKDDPNNDPVDTPQNNDNNDTIIKVIPTTRRIILNIDILISLI